jgi:hypothetical protein
MISRRQKNEGVKLGSLLATKQKWAEMWSTMPPFKAVSGGLALSLSRIVIMATIFFTGFIAAYFF